MHRDSALHSGISMLTIIFVYEPAATLLTLSLSKNMPILPTGYP